MFVTKSILGKLLPLIAETMAPLVEESFADWQLKYPEIKMRAAHLLKSREWTDCTFRFQSFQTGDYGSGPSIGCPEDSLDAHKLILAMASPAFAAMFYGDVGNKQSCITITDVDLPTFSALLEFIYSDSAHITDLEAAISLYKAANKYILVHLEKFCIDYISKELNPNNACRVYELACFLDIKVLIDQCIEMFINQTQNVLKGYSFLNAHKDTVKKIVSMDTLDIKSELDLYNALINYIDNNNNNFDQNIAVMSSKCEAEIEQKGDHLTSKNSNYIAKDLSNPRLTLNGIIEQIRFLSLTPAELAKINESAIVLLSEHETVSILTNMFSPNSKIQMPAGFSCLKQPRSKDAASVRYMVHNATNMVINNKEYSPPCKVGKLTWRISACKEFEDDFEFICIYLECCDADSLSMAFEDWSCEVHFILYLLSPKPDKIVISDCTQTFCKKEPVWGDFITEWDDLIKPESEYIQDNCITIEAYIKPGPLLGIDKTVIRPILL